MCIIWAVMYIIYNLQFTNTKLQMNQLSDVDGFLSWFLLFWDFSFIYEVTLCSGFCDGLIFHFFLSFMAKWLNGWSNKI